MRVKDLASKWGIRSKANKTEKLYEIHLKDVDAAKVAAIASLFDVHSEEEIISDLLSAALNEFEESLPYKQGNKVVALDEENDPIYEDAGLTPRFLRLKEEKLKTLRSVRVTKLRG
ncbi:MAG: pilin assembly protein [Pseudomonadales bacterium]|nr:pilin assembly protein [Pseudomonadales bacterium]